MNINDKLLLNINTLTEKSLAKANNEFGYYLSKEDRSFRRCAVEKIMDGLERENQDKVIKFMTSLLYEQTSIKLEVK